MKEILIKIVGNHGYDENDDEPLEFLTEGKMDRDEEGLFIEYEESELSGVPGCITRVVISQTTVTMKRKDELGETVGSLVFEEGIRHDGEIQTPMGPLKLEILTENIHNTITYDNKGDISVDYMMSLQGIGESRSSINMSIL